MSFDVQTGYPIYGIRAYHYAPERRICDADLRGWVSYGSYRPSAWSRWTRFMPVGDASIVQHALQHAWAQGYTVDNSWSCRLVRTPICNRSLLDEWEWHALGQDWVMHF